MNYAVQFHIECGAKAGMGRIRRSLVLPSALWGKGTTCFIHLSDHSGDDMCVEYGFAPDPAPTDKHVDLHVIDGNPAYRDKILDTIPEGQQGCIIDDTAKDPIQSDMIINPNLYASGLDYTAYDTRFIVDAMDQHLVDKSFFSISAANLPEQILVSFGGTDMGQFAGPVIRALMDKTQEKIVWAKANTDPLPDLIKRSFFNTPRLKIIEQVDMVKELSKTILYVGGAGTTALEAIASNCKITVAAIAPDQHENIKCLSSLGYAAIDEFKPAMIATLAINSLNTEQPPCPIGVDGPNLVAEEVINFLKGLHG